MAVPATRDRSCPRPPPIGSLRPWWCVGRRCTAPRSPSRAGCRSRAARGGGVGRRAGRWTGPERPEERVTLLVEALHEGVVRDATPAGARRPAAPRDGPSSTPYAAAQAGGLAPDGRAARPRGVEVARRWRPPRSGRGARRASSRSGPAATRDAGLVAAHRASSARSLVQRQGSSNQRMSRSADEAAELDRLGPLVALVGVDHDGEVGARRLARDAHPRGVLAPGSGRRP